MGIAEEFGSLIDDFLPDDAEMEAQRQQDRAEQIAADDARQALVREAELAELDRRRQFDRGSFLGDGTVSEQSLRDLSERRRAEMAVPLERESVPGISPTGDSALEDERAANMLADIEQNPEAISDFTDEQDAVRESRRNRFLVSVELENAEKNTQKTREALIEAGCLLATVRTLAEALDSELRMKQADELEDKFQALAEGCNRILGDA